MKARDAVYMSLLAEAEKFGVVDDQARNALETAADRIAGQEDEAARLQPDQHATQVETHGNVEVHGVVYDPNEEPHEPDCALFDQPSAACTCHEEAGFYDGRTPGYDHAAGYHD